MDSRLRLSGRLLTALPLRAVILVALAVWLLVDLMWLWTPSLIALFGRAAETPPELMGAYALLVVAAPLIVLATCRSSPLLACAFVLAALLLRVVLQFNPAGGSVQL